jgi:hypothetical protein
MTKKQKEIEQAMPLLTGRRVRVELTTGREIYGTVKSWSGSYLDLQAKNLAGGDTLDSINSGWIKKIEMV